MYLAGEPQKDYTGNTTMQEPGDRTFIATEDDSIGELQVAEYLLFLMCFDTYVGYLEEIGKEFNQDAHGQRGLKLLRVIDAQIYEQIRDFLISNTTRQVSQAAIRRTFLVRVSSIEHAARRALTLRTVLTRGGATVVKNMFSEARARKGVRSALAAHVLEDPATAMARYASVIIQNVRIKWWVNRCVAILEEGGPTEQVSTVEASMALSAPVEIAADTVAEKSRDLKNQQLSEEGSSNSEQMQEAQERQSEILTQAQEEATAAAREALRTSGQEDVPPVRSEVVGIATAAALAAISESENSENVPASLRKLDPEQRAAALTDGRVLVAAGAGAGKSTTLVSRVKYLVEDRGVNPSRILVSSFNKKAASELDHKIGSAIGGDMASSMTVGTLHRTFKIAIQKYGTAEERTMFEGSNFVKDGASIGSAVNRVWRKCFATEENGQLKDAQPPSVKTMMTYKTKWAGNGIPPSAALAKASSREEVDAARWYEMYMGFKGDLGPDWSPSCQGRAEAKSAWDNFVLKKRMRRTPDGRSMKVRLGDFDDMISVFLEILRRRPDVRARIHAAFDHILIDESQDLNEQQSEILQYMTEHITDGEDGKSFWMIGDPNQAIYEFRGARPDIFLSLDGKEGWKTRTIRTNYRCPPEVVEHANQLISLNSGRMDIEANASPSRGRGEASIQVQSHPDEAATAIAVAQKIKDDLDSDTLDIADNAILCRTNKELHSYETALLLRGIPYARKGASSFLGSPETKSFLGYMTLASSSDYQQMQEALLDVLNKPNRFFVSPDKVERAVDYALTNYARREGLSKKDVHPVRALWDPDVQSDLTYVLKGARFGFKADKAKEQIVGMLQAMEELESIASSEDATTNDLFEAILDMPGTKFKVDPNSGRIIGEIPITFREELTANLKDYGGGDEDPVEEEDGEEPQLALGNISFLYELAKVNPEDPGDIELSPEKPAGFWAKMERLRAKVSDLRIDISAWDKQQEALPPEDRRPPPGVFLGTAHATKGAQWPNVYVQMPKGKFPHERRRQEDEEEPTPEKIAEREAELESERRLAYVAITRPSQNLTILAPQQINGKPAGLSPFIAEAGLQMGENVRVPGEEATKTASSFEEDSKEAL